MYYHSINASEQSVADDLEDVYRKKKEKKKIKINKRKR